MKALLVCVAVAGCALTSKAPPLDVRYFSPVPLTAPGSRSPPSPTTAAVGTGVARGELPRIRLGHLTPADHLHAEIVHRGEGFELEPYETLRWTERPDAYVRRAVASALFDGRAFVEAVGGRAPTLDVDVVAFEEVRHGPARAGRVELHYRLVDDETVLASGVVTVERPAPTRRIEDIVGAIGAAMRDAAAELARRVARACAGSASSGMTASACRVPEAPP